MFEETLENVRQKKPLVHCVTNYVTVNDVANILLAIGASPVMSDEEEDALDITKISGALYINIGTLNSRTIRTILLTGKKSNELNHPVILDPVGAGASKLRTETSVKIVDEIQCAVIRGNISEIKTVGSRLRADSSLAQSAAGTTKGADADENDAATEENLYKLVSFVRALAARTRGIVAVSGAIDVVADEKNAYAVRNGCEAMTRITGSGCMLSAVTAAFTAANPQSPLEAVTAAASVMGICGERAWKKASASGYGSFRSFLIDEMSFINADIFSSEQKIERL